MFKVTPKGVLFLLSYFPGYRIHLYIPATHFFYGVYQQLHPGPMSSAGDIRMTKSALKFTNRYSNPEVVQN